MNIIQKQVNNLDLFQQKHPVIGVPIAIIKKVSDDDAGHQAALITYYGFLSLFPLLLVAASVISILSSGNSKIQQEVMQSIGSYIPVIGEQLSRNINTSSKSGVALVVGLLITFYGTRGGANAFRNAINHMWHVPKKQRIGFPHNIIVSMSMTLIGGIGLACAAILSAYTASLGRSAMFTALSTLVSLAILVPTFYFLYWISLPNNYTTNHNLIRSAITSGASVVILQSIGGYLITNQLTTLSPLYGTFAIVLGLLFWIYLQSIAVLYTVSFTIVTSNKLWPRSLSGNHLTKADKLIQSTHKNA
ncbi:YihY/virulence factor BrkB family protein [Candidatus Saccharibacteria bacterium]|nr:YihY/virulence factor BrkB family protein [Candidatus Saccharibacteria bacterium]